MEGRLSNGGSGSYRNAHRAYGNEPADVRIVQPSMRIWEFNENLRFPDYQPPGSWSPQNFPVSGAVQGRESDRQARAAGGATVVRLTQEPTRLPRAEALAVIPAALDCPDCTEPLTAPSLTGFSCTPNEVETSEAVTCTVTASSGSYDLADAVFDWGDGTNATRPISGGSADATTTFGLPGTYSVRVMVRDIHFNPSAERVEIVEVRGRTATVGASCSPSSAYANEDTVVCEIDITEAGSFPVSSWSFDMGDGTVHTRSESGSSSLQTHMYTSAGSHEVRMWATTYDGQTSNEVTQTINVTELPAPNLSSFTCTPSTVEEGESFTCSFVLDGPNTATSFRVDFGDGTINTEPASGTTGSMGHSYGSVPAGNQHTVSGRITDSLGRQSNTRTFTMNVSSPPPPTTSIGCSPSTVAMGESTTCTASASEGWTEIRWYRQATEGAGWSLVSTGPGSYTSSWSSEGVMGVRAEMDFSGFGTITEQTAVSVGGGGGFEPPTMTVSCSPSSKAPGATTSCTASTSPATTVDEIQWSSSGRVGTMSDFSATSSTRGYSWPTNGTRSVSAVFYFFGEGSYSRSFSVTTTDGGGGDPDPPGVDWPSLNLSCSPTNKAVDETTSCTATAGSTMDQISWSASGRVGGASNSGVSTSSRDYSWSTDGTRNVVATFHLDGETQSRSVSIITDGIGGGGDPPPPPPDPSITSFTCSATPSTMNTGDPYSVNCSASVDPSSHGVEIERVSGTGPTCSGSGTGSASCSGTGTAPGTEGTYSTTYRAFPSGRTDLASTASVSITVNPDDPPPVWTCSALASTFDSGSGSDRTWNMTGSASATATGGSNLNMSVNLSCSGDCSGGFESTIEVSGGSGADSFSGTRSGAGDPSVQLWEGSGGLTASVPRPVENPSPVNVNYNWSAQGETGSGIMWTGNVTSRIRCEWVDP